MVGCDGLIVSKGLCDKHRIRLKRHGHLDSTRPKDWGSREKHPLYNHWAWHRRSNIEDICEVWDKDFWKFVEDVGDRPSKRHFLRRVDMTRDLGPDNAQWVHAPLRNTEEARQYQNMYAKEWRESNPDAVKRMHLKRYFKMSLEDYNDLLESQEGVCAICGKEELRNKNDLSVDHCHDTGKVRGLLCGACNAGIGNLGDSAEKLELALVYLRKHQAGV